MISVIVPVYNGELYIAKCLNSIRLSTFTDYEVIVVNDGSIDNTKSIISDFCKKDSRFKIVNKKNGGSASARNVGLSKANGDYIIFVDSDDFISKDYLNILYTTINKFNVDIVECDFEIVDENFKFDDYKENKVIPNTETIVSNRELLNQFCNRKTYLKTAVLWNKIYKKELFNGISFVENKGIDDEYVIHKLIFNAKKICIINNKLYFYYLSPVSQMRSKPNLKKIDNIDAIERQIDFFFKKNYLDISEKLYYRYFRAIDFGIKYLKNNFPNEEMLIKSLKRKRKKWPKTLWSRYVSFDEKVLLVINMLFPGIFFLLQKILHGKDLIQNNREDDNK